jgi:hypothetical protein
MALTDISLVTVAITTLIEQVIEARDAMPEAFEVTAAPPEDDTVAGPNVVSVHLFHVSEDPYRKNLPPLRPAASNVPIQLTPMGLVLNYVVTTRNSTGSDGGDRALAEQRLLGYVARALHDFPVITDQTQIPPNPPLLQSVSLGGAHNEVQIVFRPVGVDEAVNFWSAEQELTARLALFYEARVILLDTPPPPRVPGIVLSLGNYLFPGGPPRLLRVRNVVGFVPPSGFGLPTTPFVRMASDPARVSLFAAAPPVDVDAANNHVVIEGQGLRGDRVFLDLHGPVVIDADPYADRAFRIELTQPADNPAWNIARTSEEIELDVQSTAQAANGGSVTLFPGLYRAKIVSAQSLPGDATGRLVEHSSNVIVLAITPQVVSITAGGGPATARAFSLALLGSYLGPELEVELAVGGRMLTRAAGPPGAGTFDFVGGTGQIDFVVDTTSLTSPAPVRLQIDGAEATPAWAVF